MNGILRGPSCDTIGVRELRYNVTGTGQGRTLVYFTAITHSLAFNGKGTPWA